MPGSRTCNHLFQIAASYAHALRLGVGCRIPWRYSSETWELMTYLGEACSLCPDGGYNDPVTYREPGFSYHPIPETVRYGALRGYFQSERYFKDVAEEIRSLFAPLIAPVQEGVAGVHIRMGTILTVQTCTILRMFPFLMKLYGGFPATSVSWSSFPILRNWPGN